MAGDIAAGTARGGHLCAQGVRCLKSSAWTCGGEGSVGLGRV